MLKQSLKMHKKEKDVTLGSYVTNQEAMSYLHAHNSTRKKFQSCSILLLGNNPGGQWPNYQMFPRCVGVLNPGSRNFPPPFLGFIMQFLCGEHWEALRQKVTTAAFFGLLKKLTVQHYRNPISNPSFKTLNSRQILLFLSVFNFITLFNVGTSITL